MGDVFETPTIAGIAEAVRRGRQDTPVGVSDSLAV